MGKHSSVPTKSRSFALLSYLTDEQINYCLELKKPYIAHWAYILHDKDKTEDGSLKEAHYHILLWTHTPCTVKTVRNWFKIEGVESNTLGQIVISEDDVVDYLTHDGTPEKYQYSESDVVSDNWEWFKTTASSPPSFQCLQDILAGISLLELSKRYGREFIINWAKYLELASLIKNQENYKEK